MSQEPKDYAIIHEVVEKRYSDAPDEWWTVTEDGEFLCCCYDKKKAKRIVQAMEYIDECSTAD